MPTTHLPKLLLAAALVAVVPGMASARIKCEGGYQVVRGDLIATPFCQDENLAQVARSYGMQVSGDVMRHNPNRKAEVCRFIGHDLRVREACLNYRDEPSGRGFRF